MPHSAHRACPFPGCRLYQPCPDHRLSSTPRIDPPWYRVYTTPEWRRLSRRVIAEEPICHWCTVARSKVADHVVHLADGGAPYDRANVVGSCNACNVSRGQKAAQARRMRVQAAI